MILLAALVSQRWHENKLLCFESPLYQAIWHNNIDAVRFLLQVGANPNLSPSDGYSSYGGPLILAIKLERLEMVNILLFFGADPLASLKIAKSEFFKPEAYIEDLRKLSFLPSYEVKRILSRRMLKADASNYSTRYRLEYAAYYLLFGKGTSRKIVESGHRPPWGRRPLDLSLMTRAISGETRNSSH